MGNESKKSLTIDDIELVVDDEVEVEVEVEDIDDEEGEPGEDESLKKERSVPLKALESERKKYKSRIKELEEEAQRIKTEKETAVDETALYNEYYNEYIEDGMTESLAEKRAKRDVKRDLDTNELKKLVTSGINTSVGTKYDIEFEKLQTKYNDLDDKKSELVKEARRTGYSLEQVYVALYGTKAKVTADEKRIIEQRLILDRERKNSSTVNFSAGNKKKPATPDLGLSNEELEFCQQYDFDPKRYSLMKDKDLDADTYKEKTTKRKKE